MTDLTPESEDTIKALTPSAEMEAWLRERMRRSEAAAIARDREGLAGLYEYGAFQSHDCANDQASWRDRCPVASARRLLALDAPEAQCRCGHAQRVHVTDVDWDEHSGCTSTGCDCRLFAIPEAQDGKEGSGG
jgi:hypothetical protein